MSSIVALPKPGFSSGKPGFIPNRRESPANQSLSRALSNQSSARQNNQPPHPNPLPRGGGEGTGIVPGQMSAAFFSETGHVARLA